MVCNATSTKRTRRNRAFTLPEFLIGMGVGMLVLLATSGIVLFSAKSFASISNNVDLDAHSRDALDHLTRDVRQVNRLVSNTTTNLVFEDADGSSLEYVYSPRAGTLSRVKGGTTETLLESCDSLTFSIYQRGPIGGTYDQYPTASATTCKLIEVSWKCSRNVMGTAFNTESVQTAKIVIRKQ